MWLAALLALASATVGASEAQAIVNGNVESSGKPWTVKIRIAAPRGEASFCSGALVAPRWVLTASHCVREGRRLRQVAPRRVRLFIGTKGPSGGAVRDGIEIVSLRYSAIRGRAIDDVALIRFGGAALPPGSEPLPLASRAAMAPDGTPVVFWGFGASESPPYGVLRTTITGDWMLRTVPCGPRIVCYRPAEGAASYAHSADSGAPVTAFVHGGWVQRGLFSGPGGLREKYGASVMTHLVWIRSVTGLPRVRAGTIVRDPASRMTWLVGGDGYRRWIPTGGDFLCLKARGHRVHNMSMFRAKSIPEAHGMEAVCPPERARTISAGAAHSCALNVAGAARCWGWNHSGQLGNGTRVTSRVVHPISRLRLVAIDASNTSQGVDHTCAVTIGGAAKCWGWNGAGQLGDGTTTRRLAPVGVRGMSSGAVAISTGGGHTCALVVSGAVRCWGANRRGQLGDGTRRRRLVPVTVSGLGGGVTAISAGYEHTCALLTTGALRCWGRNQEGQVGDGTWSDRLRPTGVAGFGSGVAAVSAGVLHSCALSTSGAVSCWGLNEYGQLGDGTRTTRLTPVLASGLGSGVAAIDAGGLHTCAVRSVGSATCWGYNHSGQVGDGTREDRLVPVPVSGLGGVTAIGAGGDHSCSTTAAGRALCWGWNYYGQLGDGTVATRDDPVAVVGFPGSSSAG